MLPQQARYVLGLVRAQQTEHVGKYSQLETLDQEAQLSSKTPGWPPCTAQALC